MPRSYRSKNALGSRYAGASSGKESKEAVRYRLGAPSRRCGLCSMFVPMSGECTAVEGYISADGVCDLFERAE